MTTWFTPAPRRAATVLAVLASALLALVAVSWTSTAVAGPYPPADGCAVSTTTFGAGPGDRVTVVGSGFARNETVALSIPSAAAPLGSVRTTGSGSFRSTFVWPASVTGASALVQAAAPSTTCSFTLTNGVDAVAAHRGGSGDSGSGGLSSTGFQTLTASLVAFALIGGGLLFLALARRKRV